VASLDGIVRQVRAQARMAVQLRAKHPHWRVDLAVGATPPQRALGAAIRRAGVARVIAPLLRSAAGDRALSPPQRLAAQLLATDAYYDELARAETLPVTDSP